LEEHTAPIFRVKEQQREPTGARRREVLALNGLYFKERRERQEKSVTSDQLEVQVDLEGKRDCSM
jgi:hypothetical protein